MNLSDPPLSQLKQIINENKLVDAAEIYDLEIMRDRNAEMTSVYLNGSKEPFSNIEARRRFEILTKILSWLK